MTSNIKTAVEDAYRVFETYSVDGSLAVVIACVYDAEASVVGRFLARPQFSTRIEAAFFDVEDPGLQQILSDGASIRFQTGRETGG